MSASETRERASARERRLGAWTRPGARGRGRLASTTTRGFFGRRGNDNEGGGDGASSSTDRASGFRVQCARDDKTASAAAALGGSRRHAAAIDVDHTNAGGTRERPGVDLDLFPPHGGAFGGGCAGSTSG